jgi:hypothetical protein
MKVYQEQEAYEIPNPVAATLQAWKWFSVTIFSAGTKEFLQIRMCHKKTGVTYKC